MKRGIGRDNDKGVRSSRAVKNESYKISQRRDQQYFSNLKFLSHGGTEAREDMVRNSNYTSTDLRVLLLRENTGLSKLGKWHLAASGAELVSVEETILKQPSCIGFCVVDIGLHL